MVDASVHRPCGTYSKIGVAFDTCSYGNWYAFLLLRGRVWVGRLWVYIWEGVNG